MPGFTKVDNEILEEVSRRKFNATQLSILMIVWRMTFGFNREDHEMAVSFFVQATGFSKRNVQEALTFLFDSKVLRETQKASFNQTRKIAFNLTTGEWKVDSRTKEPQVKDCSPHEEEFTSPDEQKFTSPGDESFTQERKSKENSKEKMIDQKDKPNPFADFEKLFGYLPTGMFMNQLNDWIDHSQFQDPEAIICETIKRAKLQTPNNPPAYINSVLKKLDNLGLFTLAAVQEYNANFDRKVQSNKKNAPRSLFEQGEESRRRQNEPFELSPEEEAEIEAMNLPF